ncbi:MAG TPA: acyl-CoA dehydrogenase family protein [Xanthobacteraceae bacterium]|nr:acyl-CoA dehydrogenase family protein [Xanthobacteraceae bacterium]
MDFALSEEQQLLRHSVERLFADHYAFEARKRYAQEKDGFSRALWARYAELGLLGLPFAEEHGGSGGGPVETMIVMEAIGRALALEPYFATVVLAGGLIRLGGSEALRAAIVPKIASGELILAFAHAERQSRYDLADVAATARRVGSGYMLDGAKSLVLHGDSAEKFVVSARLGGGQRDRDGIGLFLVDAADKGVSTRGYATVDGLRAAEVTFAGVRVPAEAALGTPGAAFPLIERVVDAAIAALAAEAVGAMAAMHALTVDYMKTRKQFGVTIGSFQALQHRAADMLIALEQARSMAMLATMMAAEDDVRERRAAISAAKVQIGRSGRIVGHGAIQIHGGIGMTMEASVGHYFKRVTMIDTMFGDADHHLGLLAESGGLIAA